MTWLPPFVGAILLLTLVGDVYATVFVPRGSAGPLSRRLYAASWGAGTGSVITFPRTDAGTGSRFIY